MAVAPPGGPRRTPEGVVSVADLVGRNAPAPDATATDAVGGVSVGSLLRREGRAPHSLDRPVQPRPHQQGDQSAAARRATVRRTAIAAGSLLAAGSVLGPIAFGAATSAPVGADSNLPYPGQGRLDQNGQQPAPPAGTVLDPVLGSGALDRPGTLDPGVPAPNSWAAIAFPGNVGPSVGGSAVVAGVRSGSLPGPASVSPVNLAAAAGAQPAGADPVDSGTQAPAAGGTLGQSVRDTADDLLGIAGRGVLDTPPPVGAAPAERPATPPADPGLGGPAQPGTVPVLAPALPTDGRGPAGPAAAPVLVQALPTAGVDPANPVDEPSVAGPAIPPPPDDPVVDRPAASPAPVGIPAVPVSGGVDPAPVEAPSRTPVVVRSVSGPPVTVQAPPSPLVIDTGPKGSVAPGTATTGSVRPGSGVIGPENEEPAGSTDSATPQDSTTESGATIGETRESATSDSATTGADPTGPTGGGQTDTDPVGSESPGDTPTTPAITFELEPTSSTGPALEPTTSASVGRVIAELLGG